MNSCAGHGIDNITWSKFKHDLQNTGQSSNTGPKNNHTTWKYKTSDVIYSSPSIDASGNLLLRWTGRISLFL